MKERSDTGVGPFGKGASHWPPSAGRALAGRALHVAATGPSHGAPIRCNPNIERVGKLATFGGLLLSIRSGTGSLGAWSGHVESLRICLLSYRGNPRSGGQGIYVRLLSKALLELGHQVDVWSGQPYPELHSGVALTRLPSLDLWNEDALMRMPSLLELTDPINLSEWAQSKTGSFAEPLTFSQRVARRFRQQARVPYDVVHDNQSLGPGLLELRQRVPVVATESSGNSVRSSRTFLPCDRPNSLLRMASKA